jgi:hypothetical protein
VVAALVAGGAVAGDQALPFVEPQRGGGDAAACGDLADRQPGLVPVEGFRVRGCSLLCRASIGALRE